MAEKKSILEEAMLDIKSIQNALNANTKEMLRSVAKEEIDSVVKESLVREIYEEEDIEADTEGGPDDMDALGGGDESDADSLGDIESPEGMDDVGAEPMGGPMDDLGGGADDMGPEDGMDTDVLGGDDMDMTSASDDEVMAVFKRLSGSDEIEIVGDEIHMNISEPGEYIVKMNGGTPGGGEAGMDMGMGDEEGLDGLEDMGGDEEGGEDVDYEIEMGDDEEGGEEGPDFGGEEGGGEEPDFGGEEGGEEEPEEEEESESLEEGMEEESIDEEMEEEGDTLEEKIQVGKGRNVTNGKTEIVGAGGKANNVTPPNVTVTESARTKKVLVETAQKYNALLTETMKLKNENEQFRAALKDFRTKLVETVIFNSNLTYATKLFLEHSTTKSEKDTIIKRFDEITSLTESKRLYKTIANELKNRKPISESLESKIIKESTTSTSRQLNESTAYVDPSTKRIMDLIKRVENR